MIGASLVAVSVFFGFLTLWIFRRTANRPALHQVGKRLYGHLLEFRLFYDEPVLVWRAQKAFARENLRLLALLVGPALMTLPLVWIVLQLEAVYAHAPLPIGQTAIVTAQISNALEPVDAGATLEPLPGLSIESPPVRSTVDRQISWRIRPLRPFCDTLRLQIRGEVIGKAICAGTRWAFLVERRVRSLIPFLLRPEETRLPRGEVEWVEVYYPEADVTVAGIALPWIAWFALFSAASAAAFARWLPAHL